MQLHSSHRAAGRFWPAAALAMSLPLGGAIAQTTPAPPSPATAGEKFTFKRVYKAGDVDRYQVTLRVSVDQGGAPRLTTMSMRFKETTKSASADGARTYVQEFESASSTAGGAQTDLMASMPKLTIIVDAKGNVDAKADGGETAASEQAISSAKSSVATRQAMLPPHPVGVGDTWDATLTLPLGIGPPITIKSHTKLDSIEKAGDIREAHESLTGDSKLDLGGVEGTVHYESLNALDAATGTLLRSGGHVTIEANAGGQKIDIDLTSTVKRVTAVEKPAAAPK